MSDYSENEDDPCYSSDWKEEEEKKKTKRRVSNRKTKKPRLHFESETTDNDSDSDFIPRARNTNKKRNTPKKAQVAAENVAKVVDLSAETKFASGSFVIAKSDIDAYDAQNPPHIWRIDGKALLQKFEPFEEDGELKYRNTSIYTGWSPIESDKYAPLQDIDMRINNNQKIILTFNKKQLREIDVDSD